MRTNLLAVVIPACLTSPSLAQTGTLACSHFHDALSGSDSVKRAGGTVSGRLAFATAVNGNGAVFDGSADITYRHARFDSPSGSIALWFRPARGSTTGGIGQIGAVGTKNSFGLFYNSGTNLYFEVRNDANTYYQIAKAGVLARDRYTHIVASWDRRPDGYHLKLFLNGRFAGGRIAKAPILHRAGSLQLGKTGYYGRARGAIDEVRFFPRQVSDSEAWAEYVYSSRRFRRQPTAKTKSTGRVTVSGRHLHVGGRRFVVKGVGYQPIPIGQPNTAGVRRAVYSDSRILERDIALLRDLGVNTVRLWSNLETTHLLDALWNDGKQPIRAILAFEVPHENVSYADAAFTKRLRDAMRAHVRRFKSHPAVLAWAIGNEPNLHYRGNVADWYALANSLAKVAYEEEKPSWHPTIVVNGFMRDFGNTDLGSDDASMEFVDCWGHNTYQGRSFDCYFDYYDAISSKPLILTEFGIDAFDDEARREYAATQAGWLVRQWREIRKRSAGGSVMAFADEWHKFGPGRLDTHDRGGYSTDTHPDGFANEEWWGVCRPRRNGTRPDLMEPRLAYHALAHEFDEADLTVRGTPRLGRTVWFDVADPSRPSAVFVLPLALGRQQGIPIGHRRLALDPDPLFHLTVSSPDAIGLSGTRGKLDARGEATASWSIPNAPVLANVAVYAAFVTLDPAHPRLIASMSPTVAIRIAK